MKILDHAFNVDGLRRSDCADVRECGGCVPTSSKNGVHKIACALRPKHRNVERSVVDGTQPHTVQEIRRDTKRGKRVMTYSGSEILVCEILISHTRDE